MQTPSYPLYQATDNNLRTDSLGLVIVIGIHALIILIALWTPSTLPVPDTQAAAPKVMEVSLLTATPPQPVTELAPGPQQLEAAATPQSIKTIEQQEELLTHKDAQTTISDAPKTPEPVKEDIPETREEEVVTEQQVPAQPAPDTTAPTALPAAPAETATAANMGANQQQLHEVQNWQQQLQTHLERRKRYPRQAQMRNQEGMPWVKFSMDRNGQVLSVTLAQSSGVDSLDKEALALVKRAAPLPAPPPEVEGETITLTVPIEFFINQ
jgi:protein TonB